MERTAFSLFRIPSIHHRDVLAQIRRELNIDVHRFLLYYTGDYKNTRWIGVVEDGSHREMFVKVYKKSAIARTEYEKTEQAYAAFTDFFRIATPQSYSEHVLALSVLRKKQNVSVQDVWRRVVEQSVSLYRKEKRLGLWDAYATWAPAHLRETPAVLAHGDLSHWNCFVDEQNVLCLIDYEEVGWYPPMYDCFHLLLKPILLHRPAEIPHDACMELARSFGCSFAQVLVWLVIYLECENEKDRIRNEVLKNQHIEQTIQNRLVLLDTCKKDHFRAVQKK